MWKITKMKETFRCFCIYLKSCKSPIVLHNKLNNYLRTRYSMQLLSRDTTLLFISILLSKLKIIKLMSLFKWANELNMRGVSKFPIYFIFRSTSQSHDHASLHSRCVSQSHSPHSRLHLFSYRAGSTKYWWHFHSHKYLHALWALWGDRGEVSLTLYLSNCCWSGDKQFI